MNKKIRDLQSIRANNCITIIMTSHRTKPDYLNDGLRLKNLIKEVETRLYNDVSKREADKLLSRVQELADNIDHSQNIESLILFVNDDVAEIMRLPIKVNDRVVIDETFATRDLIRALHKEVQYYILVLSQDNTRLIEASSNKSVREVSGDFPYKNNFVVDRTSQSVGSKQTNILLEYFNRTDKKVNEVLKENPLPVFICGLEENLNQYMKVVDRKETILPVQLNKNMINSPIHKIVEESWEIMRGYIIKRNNERKEELRKAVTENKFLSDTNQIWKAIQEGRIQTIFVEQGLFQPAILTENNEIQYVSDDRRNETEVIDDIYDEMIEMNMDFGGDVIFLPKGELQKFNGFGAITRY